MVKSTENSNLTKSKQHHAQSQLPVPTPSTSKKKENTNSEETIQELLLHIKKLEKKVKSLSGELNVAKRVNTLLSQSVDELEQYQRGSCIIIDEINLNKDGSVADITSKAKNVLNKHHQISKEEIEKQVGKCQRIGPKDEDGTQATILKFKSHSFKELVYHSRKKIKNRKIKVKISLSKKRRKVLSYAHQATANIPNVDFPYLGINGNLKLRLKEYFNKKKVFIFKSKEELHSLFERFNCKLPADNEDANKVVS